MGRVYWLTGLAGSGKTTLGKLLHSKLALNQPNVVLLDGDHLRLVFGNDLGHSRGDRLKLAYRYSRLCKMLADQGQIVVCCTISLFHEVQLWNRENIIGYKEVFIDVPLEVLAQRDQKNLYSRAARGEVSDVVGYDIAPEFPEKPDFIVNNSGSILPEEQLAVIWKALVAPTLL